MAKQDFVNGGFRGKLGQLIGQRWLEKYTVRAYFKPGQPRTGKQQANRQLFRQAVELVNIANQYNQGAPMWRKQGSTSYNARMSQAKKTLQEGITGENAIPIYRLSATPEVIIDDLVLATAAGGYQLKSAKWSALSESRSWSISAILYDTLLEETYRFIYRVTNTPGDENILTVPSTGRYIYNGNTSFLGITNDDKDFNDTFIFIQNQAPLPEDVVQISDFQVTADSEYAVTASSASFADLDAAYTVSVQYEVIDGLTAVKSTKTATATSVVGSALSVSLPLDKYETMTTGCKVVAYATPVVSGGKAISINTVTAALGVKTCTPTIPTRTHVYINPAAGKMWFYFYTSDIPSEVTTIDFPENFPVATQKNGIKEIADVVAGGMEANYNTQSFWFGFAYSEQLLAWVQKGITAYYQINNSNIIMRLAFQNIDTSFISPTVYNGVVTLIGALPGSKSLIALQMTTTADSDFSQSLTSTFINPFTLAEEEKTISFTNTSFSGGTLTATLPEDESSVLDISGSFVLNDVKIDTSNPLTVAYFPDTFTREWFVQEYDIAEMNYTATINKTTKVVTITIGTGAVLMPFANAALSIGSEEGDEIPITEDDSVDIAPTDSSDFTFDISNGMGSISWTVAGSLNALDVGETYTANIQVAGDYVKNGVTVWQVLTYGELELEVV